MEFGFLDSLGQFGAGRFHQRRVEGAPHFQFQGAACSGGRQQFAGFVDGLDFARNHNLARAVIVGADKHAVNSLEDFLHLLVGQRDDGGHCRRFDFAGFLHGVGACGDKFQTVLERKGAGGYQSRKFAQRVSGHHVGLLAAFDGGNHRVEEHGRLSDVGAAKVFVGAVEHEVGDTEPEYIVCFFKKVAGRGRCLVQVLAHTDKLRALTGKNVCFHLFPNIKGFKNRVQI